MPMVVIYETSVFYFRFYLFFFKITIRRQKSQFKKCFDSVVSQISSMYGIKKVIPSGRYEFTNETTTFLDVEKNDTSMFRILCDTMILLIQSFGVWRRRGQARFGSPLYYDMLPNQGYAKNNYNCVKCSVDPTWLSQRHMYSMVFLQSLWGKRIQYGTHEGQHSRQPSSIPSLHWTMPSFHSVKTETHFPSPH